MNQTHLALALAGGGLAAYAMYAHTRAPVPAGTVTLPGPPAYTPVTSDNHPPVAHVMPFALLPDKSAGTPRILPHPSTHPAPAHVPNLPGHAQPFTLRLGTFNVHNASTVAQTNETLSKLIQRGDVFGLGEMTGAHAGVYSWLHVHGWGHYKGRGQTPVVWNTHKYELVDSGDFALNKARHVEDKHSGKLTRGWVPQYANWVRLRNRTTGHEFYVINAHTIPAVHASEHHSVRQSVMREQFRTLAHATNMFSRHAPVFVTGDMNMSPTERIWPKAILASAHLRSNWDYVGTRHFGHGTFGRTFIDNILSLTNVPHLHVESTHIYGGGVSDHRAQVTTYSFT